MVTFQQQLQNNIADVLQSMVFEPMEIPLARPEMESHGDYSTSVALQLAKILKKNPMQIADELSQLLREKQLPYLEKIEVAAPGFINFWLKQEALIQQVAEFGHHREFPSLKKGTKIMVEYAHPNTHKEMHIGHMRTLVTGESIARILENSGVQVFRANYQGDIGLHVAKALYGIKQMMGEQRLSLSEIKKWSSPQKAHFLGQGYARGSAEYETHKDEINSINADLYAHTGPDLELYDITRQWSLDYYDEFYKQFYTSFDRLFFESEMAECGKQVVQDHIGDVFQEDNGAVIFPGEKYGLHTRVFITSTGFPTYEGKDICNAFQQYKVFPFDTNIHVVASEQEGYFQVVFKALELIDPQKFTNSEYHLSMGMVQLKDRKMSSRTGDVFTVDSLIDQVRERVNQIISDTKVEVENTSEVVEKIVIGAIKYSVLKAGTRQNATFDIETSVSIDGNSGPYLQYTYARTRSIIRKSKIKNQKSKIDLSEHEKINSDERSLLRELQYFPEVVGQAAESLEPSYIATYLFNLAQKYNEYYHKHKVVGSEQEEFRLALTDITGQVLKTGLQLLGIETVEKM